MYTPDNKQLIICWISIHLCPTYPADYFADGVVFVDGEAVGGAVEGGAIVVDVFHRDYQGAVAAPQPFNSEHLLGVYLNTIITRMYINNNASC